MGFRPYLEDNSLQGCIISTYLLPKKFELKEFN